ncbi:MAG: hypothetical protein ACHBN1_37120 [Heteroscytonema crispum UTEX LB 1556]
MIPKTDFPQKYYTITVKISILKLEVSVFPKNWLQIAFQSLSKTNWQIASKLVQPQSINTATIGYKGSGFPTYEINFYIGRSRFFEFGVQNMIMRSHSLQQRYPNKMEAVV